MTYSLMNRINVITVNWRNSANGVRQEAGLAIRLLQVVKLKAEIGLKKGMITKEKD